MGTVRFPVKGFYMHQTVSFGGRLREERKRLGKSQEVFGGEAGVTKKTQMLYEKEERKPDAEYMAALATMGVDVLYVLTGQRGGAPPLSPDETALLDNYRHSPEERRRILQETSAAFAESPQRERVNKGCG